jgi:hypothetical protein
VEANQAEPRRILARSNASANPRSRVRRSVLRLHDIRAALNFARFHVVLQECGHLDGFLNAFQVVRVGLPLSRMG